MCKHILFNEFGLDDIETLKVFCALTYDKDGFGAIIRTTTGDIETMKDLNAGYFYMELMERIYKGDIQTLVVHHRTSTNKDGIDYAHPFEFQGNFLTHNGVVSVPGEHDTKTENDSELLLHHLIKSDFETLPIKGYFSCFILNHLETIVLVDAVAPIYTNGRIYSSHNLSDDFVKVELKLLRLDAVTGEIMVKKEIEVTESNFGREVSHLSLGPSEEKDGMTFTTNDEGFYYEDDAPSFSKNVRDFFDLISDQELHAITVYRDRNETKMTIMELGYAFGIDLDDGDLRQISELL